VTHLAAASPSVWDEPGTLGFLVVFGMSIVLFFVFRSMSRHLRKVRDAAGLEAEQAEQAESGEASDGASAGGAADTVTSDRSSRA
jgi:hypothetical protein